ncbi:hypothetical protein PAECIP111891_02706 [Paenibacillus allorhizoplanae]|uniref:Endospore appendages core domain-containing protein n=1 Tax=Paenibacillus allorhizoplanae TaxID=2905648 RepID=A0ABM9C7I3_9BACL|nr:S-Ena type endospore appendage [Paenibacillus allorhizoplanae]CAH1205201.1 hypothetical protein PAECIP111891_02706 [Paenibacillus allorhizoplanae]
MCSCNSALCCCSEKTYVQDKVCTNWLMTTAGTTTVYTDNMATLISGTGYVKNETGTADITVAFLRSAAPVITAITVQPGGSTSFTVGRFDTITITTTAAATGEFCITVRYSM